MCRFARGSRLLVGSSRTSTSGRIESTVASAMRFFCPKDRCVPGLLADVGEPDGMECFVHARVDLVARQAHVERAERDVVIDGGHEELVVGVLEHEPDARRGSP